ncbi:hypothetical protein PVAND_012710 [Polypedilum vanderplanki]|uniref:Uncharacterized protein n=1 Tax=Polypedilum vanderplanki TaxID=319348 RepID=A0A9J6CN87_POLVA|nr:hypothetical protein PVAND_012710 [Polypedilum vanderplanki]
MNLNINNSVKLYSCNQDGSERISSNTQFSGIFNKSALLSESQFDQESESSTTSTITENNEFTFNIPTQINHKQNQSPKKEISLSDYFKSLQMLENINNSHMKILKRITSISPNTGCLSMKTSSQNKLENVIYYNPTNSKVINYKIIEPLDLNLVNDNGESEGNFNQAPIKKRRKVGRPRNDAKKLNQQQQQPISKSVMEQDEDIINHRTKYGRIIKFTPEVAKMLQVDESRNLITMPETIVQSAQVIDPQQQQPQQLEQPIRKQRKISSEFRCITCKKVYLGKNKMNHHLKLNPDHRAFSNESDLFSHLMKLVRQKKTNEAKANVFFKELSSFVQQCEKFTPKLITNKELSDPNVHHHKIDKNAASVLRINPGTYSINMNVFDRNFKFDNPNNLHHQEELPEHSINNIVHNIEEEVHQENGHNEVMKALDVSLDGNEVNLLIPQTTELTNLTNISDIITSDTHEGDDNALLGFLN